MELFQAQVNFSGRGCFGGPKNKYVCCSSQGKLILATSSNKDTTPFISEGEIFIWDRETGLPLCTIQPCDEEHVRWRLGLNVDDTLRSYRCFYRSNSSLVTTKNPLIFCAYRGRLTVWSLYVSSNCLLISLEGLTGVSHHYIGTSREPPRRSQVISPDQMDLDDMGYFAENNGGPALIEGPYCS